MIISLFEIGILSGTFECACSGSLIPAVFDESLF